MSLRKSLMRGPPVPPAQKFSDFFLNPPPAEEEVVLDIAIVGGGISGLGAAIAIATGKRKHNITVYDSGPGAKVNQWGSAGLRLTPNGTRILRRWNLLGEMLSTTTTLEALTLVRRDGSEVLAHELGLSAALEAAYSAPALMFSDNEFHTGLMNKAKSLGVTIKTASDLVAVDGVAGTFSLNDGAARKADLIIGADGLWSGCRMEIVGSADGLATLATSVDKWRLMSVPALPTWVSQTSSLVILGDAAHSDLPYLHQGASVALEDAETLSVLLDLMLEKTDLPQALKDYDNMRRERCDTLMGLEATQRAILRHAVGETQKPMSLLWMAPEHQPTIFGYDVETDVRNRKPAPTETAAIPFSPTVSSLQYPSRIESSLAITISAAVSSRTVAQLQHGEAEATPSIARMGPIFPLQAAKAATSQEKEIHSTLADRTAAVAASLYLSSQTLGPGAPGTRGKLDLAIIGTGVGALSAAIAVAETGKYRVTIYGDASAPNTPAHTGIQLAPNGARVLDTWGVIRGLMPISNEPTSLLISRHDGSRALGFDGSFGDEIRRTYISFICNVTEGDLRAALLCKVKELGVSVRVGAGLKSANPARGEFTLADGQVVSADLVLGVDGIDSRCRKAILGKRASADPVPMKEFIYSATINIAEVIDDDLREMIARPALRLWIGPGAYVVGYSLDSGKIYNLTIHASEKLASEHHCRNALDEIRHHLRTWDKPLQGLLAHAHSADKHRVMTAAQIHPADRVHNSGRFVLVGAAAHPTSSHLGQPENLALEDAAALAVLLSRADVHSLPEFRRALRAFDCIRSRRYEFAARDGARQRDVFQLYPGAEQRERDRVLEHHFGGRPLEGTFPCKWLCPEYRERVFGYDATDAAAHAWDRSSESSGSGGPGSARGSDEGVLGARGGVGDMSATGKRLALCVLCAAQFLNVYAASTVVIALPAITNALNAQADSGGLQWIISAYSSSVYVARLSFASLLLLFGRLTDYYGKKRVFLIGMAWLTAATVFCGFSRSVIMLVIGRALMGVGAAASIPSALGSIADLYTEPKERNWAFSMFGASSPIGFIFGLFIGGEARSFDLRECLLKSFLGILSEALGWPWVFFVYAMVALADWVAGYFVLPADKISDVTPPRLDIVGAALSTLSLLALTYGIVTGPSVGWNQGQVIAPLIASAVGFGLFILWERQTPNPLVPGHIFTRRVTLTLVVIFCIVFSFEGFSVNANLAFQNVFAFTPIMTAIHMIPMVAVGFITAAGTGLLHHTTSYWTLPFPSLCLIVAGFDVAFNVANIVLMSSVAEQDRGIAGGVFNTAVQLATGVTMAVQETVANALNEEAGGSGMRGYAATFLFGLVVLGVSGALVALFWGSWGTLAEEEPAPLASEPREKNPEVVFK
ncbi:hypothetical protein HK101_001973 [Irineochytrium annulatum]|nr:hypothetical protein HK101_001973 [Irineochytrium annulatum]